MKYILLILAFNIILSSSNAFLCDQSNTAIEFTLQNTAQSLMCVDNNGVLQLPGDIIANRISLTQLHNQIQNLPTNNFKRYVFKNSIFWTTPPNTKYLVIYMYSAGGYAFNQYNANYTYSTCYKSGNSGAYAELFLNSDSNINLQLVVGKSSTYNNGGYTSLQQGVFNILLEGGKTNNCTENCSSKVITNIPNNNIFQYFNGTDATNCSCENVNCGKSKGIYSDTYGYGGYGAINTNNDYIQNGGDGVIIIDIY